MPRSRSSRVILFVLVTVMISLGGSAAAEGTSTILITLSSSTIDTPINSTVTDVVTVGNTDPTKSHTVTLLLTQPVVYGVGVVRGSFSPETITIPPGGTARSTLTILVPDVCPDGHSPGPYSQTYTVEAREGEKNPWSSPVVGSAPLLVNITTGSQSPPSIRLTSSRLSYAVGETVGLTIHSNVPIGYLLTVRGPEGRTWASWAGMIMFPTTFTQSATRPIGNYTAELEAYYCGTWRTSVSFSVVAETYEVTISLAGLPANVTTSLQVDGSKVTDMKGDEARLLAYPIGTSHTLQVNQYVNDVRYSYYCAENTWTAAADGSHMFSYVAWGGTTTSSTANETTSAHAILTPSSSRIVVYGGDWRWVVTIGVAMVTLASLAIILILAIILFRTHTTRKSPRVCKFYCRIYPEDDMRQHEESIQD